MAFWKLPKRWGTWILLGVVIVAVMSFSVDSLDDISKPPPRPKDWAGYGDLRKGMTFAEVEESLGVKSKWVRDYKFSDWDMCARFEIPNDEWESNIGEIKVLSGTLDAYFEPENSEGRLVRVATEETYVDTPSLYERFRRFLKRTFSIFSS